ncbi:SusC/RagA family TonB-linked outer membrane protein [uncultured Bacteroides sp.]|uniref:SusC/RagA family TonB-linked outer membrane protein n=1 Tax=uncultured Bacteroides sp. TaxID=162156 RepID=UPI0037485B30
MKKKSTVLTVKLNSHGKAYKAPFRQCKLGLFSVMIVALFATPAASAFAEQTINNSQTIQQEREVRGIIIDERGEPLIGVSVLVKGTSSGTITDINGQFSLKLTNGNKELVISYIGYHTQTIEVGAKTSFSIQMKPDTKTLDEVVVIGYGTVKKRDLTGAVTSIKSSDITQTPASNPMEALQGKVAGLDITKSSGQAGSGVNIQLRGTRSFTASGTPTFIIDGMPGDYSTLNPNDIESIEVLKDASSTAIYGSAGANGIIIVTTKSGKEGKTAVNFNAYTGFNGWSKTPTMRSGESYIQALRDANATTGNWSSTSDDEALFTSAEAYQAHLAGHYINWSDLLIQTGMTQNYSMSVSGGTEKTKAYFSLNFSDENGQYKGDDYKVYSTNIRIDHKIKKWLSAGINLQASYVYQNKAYANLESALCAVPLGEAYDSDGNININPVVNDGNEINLLLNTVGGVYKNQNQNFKIYANPYIQLNPIKGLTLISRLNGTLVYARNNYFQGQGSYQYYTTSGADATGTNSNVYAAVTQNRSYNYKWENVLTYDFKINNDHAFTLTGVTTWNHNQSDNSYLKQDNITENKFLWHGISSNTAAVAQTSYNMSKGLGIIGRINYSYLGKYLFSASVRYDGSSVLARENRWDTFPAVSLGWRISDEKFMEGTKEWLDNLKLRIGYGVAGTASINPYTSVAHLDQSYYSLGGEKELVYMFSQNYTNKNLSWEKSYNTNIGLDIAILKNRIDLTTDFYFTKTDGVIWKRYLPVNNGAYNASTQYYTNMNICSTQNKGIELALNTRNIETPDFKWKSTITYTYNKEKIKSLADGTSDYVTNGDYTLAKGYAVNSYYQYKTIGIWQKGEEQDAAVFGQNPGDIKIEIPNLKKQSDGVYLDKEGTEYTANNTYTISANDYQIIGHNSPDWTLGFQNTFNWKDFDLSVFMYMRWGQMIDYSMLTRYDPTGKSNFPKYFNYWTESNPSNDFPAINANMALKDYTGYYGLSYVDGSFFKIKNVTLGYNLPKKISNKLGIDKLRVYGTITNPFIIAKSHLLKDYDPEMNGSLNYPLTKQLVFGLNLSF